MNLQMQELIRKINEIINNRDWTLADLADAVPEIPYETLRNIMYHKTDDIKAFKTLIPLARALGVTTDYLLGVTTYPEEEFRLLKNYRNCSSHGKHFVMAMSTFESDFSRFENTQNFNNEIDFYEPKPVDVSSTIEIPCLEPTGYFKDGIFYDTSIKTRLKTYLKNVFMAIKIPNDSLAHTYYQNDILFLSKRNPTIGEIAVFHKDDTIYIRQFKKDGNKYILRSLSIDSEDLILSAAEYSKYSIVGTCTSIYRKTKKEEPI